MSEQTEQTPVPQFWMVWREGSDRNTPTFRHPDYDQALCEAKRLTRMTGGTFHVLAHMATVERIDIKVTEVDSIPF